MVSICPILKWSGCLVFKLYFENRTICNPTSSWPFEYQTSIQLFKYLNVLFSDPHCIWIRRGGGSKFGQKKSESIQNLKILIWISSHHLKTNWNGSRFVLFERLLFRSWMPFEFQTIFNLTAQDHQKLESPYSSPHWIIFFVLLSLKKFILLSGHNFGPRIGSWSWWQTSGHAQEGWERLHSHLQRKLKLLWRHEYKVLWRH